MSNEIIKYSDLTNKCFPSIEIIRFDMNNFENEENLDLTLLQTYLKNNLNNIKEMYLESHYLGAEAIIELSYIWKNMMNLKVLSLPYNSIGISGLDLFESLDDKTKLTHLNLSGNSLNITSGIYLGNVLVKLKSLEVLNLQDNSLGDEESLIGICNAFQKLPNLLDLNLGGNSLNKIGITLLSNVLDKLVNVHTLRLGGNNLKDDVIKMTNKLPTMKSLKILELRNNGITSNNLNALKESLGSLISLTILDFAHNKIDRGGIINFKSTLINMTCLRKLDFSYNSINSDGLRILCNTIALRFIKTPYEKFRMFYNNIKTCQNIKEKISSKWILLPDILWTVIKEYLCPNYNFMLNIVCNNILKSNSLNIHIETLPIEEFSPIVKKYIEIENEIDGIYQESIYNMNKILIRIE
jgi:hypothetical protein